MARIGLACNILGPQEVLDITQYKHFKHPGQQYEAVFAPEMLTSRLPRILSWLAKEDHLDDPNP